MFLDILFEVIIVIILANLDIIGGVSEFLGVNSITSQLLRVGHLSGSFGWTPEEHNDRKDEEEGDVTGGFEGFLEGIEFLKGNF